MRIDKEFETTQETSERLNVTARTIQKWAATGKIPGAIKYGNVWMIPKGITLSRKAVVEKAEEYIISTEQMPVFFVASKRPAMWPKFAKRRTESCADSAPERTWQSHGRQFRAVWP